MRQPRLALFGLAASVLTTLTSTAAVDFYKEVYPILKESCISCHGPKKQKGKLRLDTAEWIMKGVKGEPVVVAGKPTESEFLARVILPADDDDVMPPEGDGDPLTKEQQDIIRKWIEEGANFGEMPTDLKAGHGHGEAKKTVEELLGAKMPAPSEVTLKKLADNGALAATLAQKLNAVRVDFSLSGDKITDHEVAPVTGLADQVVWLNLARTKVTDAGLATVAKLPNLTRLHLENTAVGDAGMKHLAGLEHLTYLNLYGTKVTDAGIKQLAGLKNLQALYLWKTGVTKEGATALLEALPNCSINLGADLEIGNAETPAGNDQAAVNSKCPVSGKPVDAAKTALFTKQVSFCCNKCKGKFVENPDSFIGKVDLTAKELNGKCPVSGKDADASVTAPYSKTVGFCCDKCKAKFEANPESFISKVE